MFFAKLRRVGNSFVVTIPNKVVQQLGLAEGQMVALEIQRAELRPEMRPEVSAAFERSWERHEEGYRYLANR